MATTPATMQPSAEEAAHRAHRERRLKWSIGTALLVRPLAVLIPVIVIPVFSRYLGVERYGLYETVGSLAAWVALSNIGMGMGLTNRLMDCHVSGDRELARRYVSTLFVAMLGILVISGSLISIMTLALDWPALLNATEAVRGSELRWSVWLACMIPLAGLGLSIAPAVYTAHQELFRQNAWDGIAKVATVLACLAVPSLGLGIPGAILAISAVPIAISTLSHAHLWLVLKPWLRPSLRLFRLEHLRALLGDGVLLFLLQSSVVLLFQSDRLIINITRSPEEVAQYSVISRIFMLAYGAFILVLGPLWPAYGEAVRRGDLQWCRRKLKLTFLIGLLCIGATGAAMAVGGDRIVRLLVGNQFSGPSLIVIAGMTVGCCLRAWADSHAILLNSANVLMPQVYLLAANALLAIAINIILTKFFGIAGTAWSYPIAAVATTIWAYPWILRRFLWSRQTVAATP